MRVVADSAFDEVDENIVDEVLLSVDRESILLVDVSSAVCELGGDRVDKVLTFEMSVVGAVDLGLDHVVERRVDDDAVIEDRGVVWNTNDEVLLSPVVGEIRTDENPTSEEERTAAYVDEWLVALIDEIKDAGSVLEIVEDPVSVGEEML